MQTSSLSPRGPRTLDRILPKIIDHLVVDPVGGAPESELAQRS